MPDSKKNKSFAASVAKNISKRGLTDVLDPHVWKSYSEYSEIAKNGLYLQADDVRTFAEQFIYRMVMCQPCVDAGECATCTCPCPEKMMAPSAKCPLRQWPEMMNTPEWREWFDKHYQFALIPKII